MDKEQVDYHTLNPIRLEATQFAQGSAWIMWEGNKYGKSKYHHIDPMIKGEFLMHMELTELSWGLN